jgi:hypothetical protein
MNRPAPKTVRRRFLVALGHAIHVTWPVLSTILAIQVALGLLIGFVEGWSVGDAVYFAFVTGLTIGYGDAFKEGLSEASYVEGKNVAVEYRWTQGENDRLPGLAADLVHRQVAVIVDPRARRRGDRMSGCARVRC